MSSENAGMYALASLLALSLACAPGRSEGDGSSGTDGAGSSESSDGGEPTTGDAAVGLVYAEGTQLRAPNGDPLTLRGPAIGGWLFHETWISCFDYPTHGRLVVEAEALGVGPEVRAVVTGLGPADEAEREAYLADAEAALAPVLGADTTATLLAAVRAAPYVWDDSDAPLLRALEQRYGVDGRDQVVEAYQAAWFTDLDLDRIAGLGLDAVRIPIGWRDLVVHSGDGPPTAPLVLRPAVLARIDALLDACEARGLYAILDLQESPGGHNDYAGPATLYTDPEMQALTIDLWTALSRRYRERTVVAAYSLLAEPFSAPSVAAMVDMYDRLHDAIRGQGDEHLLVIHDGFKGLEQLPAPAEVGWTGVVYSTHLFDWGVTTIVPYRLLGAVYAGNLKVVEQLRQVPVLVGSFSTIVDNDAGYEALALYLDHWQRSGFSWGLWTYKRIDDPLDEALFGTTTLWGALQRPRPGWQRPDLARDDLTTLLAKVATMGSEQVEPNARMLDVLQTHGAGVPAPVEQVGEGTALGGCALEPLYCVDFECTNCPDAAAQRTVLTIVCAEALHGGESVEACPAASHGSCRVVGDGGLAWTLRFGDPAFADVDLASACAAMSGTFTP